MFGNPGVLEFDRVGDEAAYSDTVGAVGIGLFLGITSPWILKLIQDVRRGEMREPGGPGSG